MWQTLGASLRAALVALTIPEWMAPQRPRSEDTTINTYEYIRGDERVFLNAESNVSVAKHDIADEKHHYSYLLVRSWLLGDVGLLNQG